MIAPSWAEAADACRAEALVDLRPTVNSGPVVRRGQTISGIETFRRSPRGRTSFCDQSDHCFSEQIVVAGKKVNALRVNENCVVDVMDVVMDKGDEIYSVAVINSPTRRKNIYFFQGLLKLGMDDTAATFATNANVDRPDSECARLARAALSGNENAKRTLLSRSNACKSEKRQ